MSNYDWQWVEENPQTALEIINNLERENAELEATLSMVCDANQRGIRAWQQAHPDKSMVWPDQAKLVEWLVSENAALREEFSKLTMTAAQTADRNVALREDNAALREWVKEEGKRNDVCTYGILKEVCEDCRCGRRKEAKP